MRSLAWISMLLRRALRRTHEPRLWPSVFVNIDTGEVSYELGVFNQKLGRVCAR